MNSFKIVSAILVTFLITSSFQPCVYAAESGVELFDTSSVVATPTDDESETDVEICSPEYVEKQYDSDLDRENSESILKFYANADLDYEMDDIISSIPLEEVTDESLQNKEIYMRYNSCFNGDEFFFGVCCEG